MDTRLQPNKNPTLFYLFGFVFLLLVVTAIPTYFFFKGEFEKNKKSKQTQMMHYAQMIEKEMVNKNYELPLSLRYFSALYDANGYLITTTSQSHFPEFLNQITHEKGDFFYYRSRLEPNVYDAGVVVIAIESEKKIIYIKLLLVILALFIFFLLSTWFLIKATISPYQQINRYLDSFFNDAMHELKTPIGVIQFNLELLEEKEPGKKELKRAMNGVKGLQFIYEDIEYLIKHKNITYKKHSIDFSSLLFHRVDFFTSFAKAKNIMLHPHIHDHIFITMNPVELQRIIDNTLSNAIKYSHPNGSVSIELMQNEHTIFCVQDSGIGIKDRKKIFERYHREENIQGGFGIGLNIVKTICEKNNITIKLNSTLGKGSSFCYHFMPQQEPV